MFPHIPLNQSPIPGNRSVQLKKKKVKTHLSDGLSDGECLSCPLKGQ